MAGRHTQEEWRAEEERQHERELLLARAERIGNIGSWRWDIGSSVMTWSDNLYRIYGLDLRGFVPSFQGFLELLPSEERLVAQVAVAEGLRLGSFVFEHRAKRPDGTDILVEVRGEVVHDGDGRPVRMFGIARDITEERRKEDSQSHLAAILSSSSDAVIATTLEGVVTAWNKGAESLFGYEAEEMIGRPVDDLIPEHLGTAADRIREALEPGGAYYEERRLRKNGDVVDVAVSLSPVIDSGGQVVGISAIARDISERKRLEEQLRQAQKMEAVGRLAGGVAHDFNNVLTAILGNCELLLEDAGLDFGARQQVLEIQEAAAVGESIAGQLLEISRPRTPSHQVADLRLVLTEMESVLRRLLGETIELELRLPAGPIHVKGEAAHLEQVILNLAVNACDAMLEGGRFSIVVSSLDIQPGDPLQRLGLTTGPHAVISAQDTGVGIEPDALERIFEPFFSMKGPDASGLGLSTVYQIVSQMGGNVSVSSEVGAGTTFRILLPCTTEAAARPPRRPVPPALVQGERSGRIVESSRVER